MKYKNAPNNILIIIYLYKNDTIFIALLKILCIFAPEIDASHVGLMRKKHL